ncbi:hypothetical protein [Priestia aryabhattai]|uniref:hypothetical protein n=1 Tax=Priestia aryabhattai TaxID=412384 RepID=UPI002E1A2F9C|nr:hypothetical protein [Priestia aryabhattai]MED4262192.1 hypothetical protein [Priestia aryabhattai]
MIQKLYELSKGGVFIKASTDEIDYLVDHFIRPHHKILHHLEKGWLQLDDYKIFFKQMKEDIYYNDCYAFISSGIIEVHFNHYQDNKVHFHIPAKFDGKRVCTYEAFSKRVWNYFKGKRFKQLTLF